MTAISTRLGADGLTLGYGEKAIARDLTVEIPDNKFTVIIGPNACGKSTLLRALSRLLAPTAGSVVLDGKSIEKYSTKEVAKILGLLPQTSIPPEDIRVAELVSRGRYPHQQFLRQWSQADEDAVAAAMVATGVAHLAGERVDRLSGGQRQRVWVALVLAQETPLVLLDEPTTYLDIAFQVELLDLCRRLQREENRTVVAVLHDLNQACRYADHIIAMRAGEVIAAGAPADVVTADLVAGVFGLACRIIDDPESNTPLVIPVWQTT
ncbi:MAG: ABC transporter ATP-binding protein [Gordonia sp.]|uniref:ABC transporter ATP-binding protein n=1 Tax=Gordonia sp. (in: high G+C Gram-positive bacteria) TaxID=84139 RepID=UPI001D81B817|nr:ABC transporter ATP-binding protein [Gordonia sp. (in: high G+C Gram-positive bacteria)]MCB1294669.1 ABC transporter ATP-binding protein [Gordonia sp. (in: high G+C Gram-positive bacteria)]HQV19338.1 ABC transporter ATP-binding protein [Gordonia sp. (in: high G+C Gram-positive bacteria)]